MFNKTLRTVDATLNILDVKEMGVNVGVSCYADTVRQIFQMDYFYSKTTIKSKINGMKRQTNVGLVNIQNALNRTCRVMFSSRAGGRAKAVNYLVVISPMTSVKDTELDAVVAYCKSRSVRIISITEGSSSVISNTIAYDSTYQFELKDENTVAKSLSTLIRDNAGCKEGAYCYQCHFILLLYIYVFYLFVLLFCCDRKFVFNIFFTVQFMVLIMVMSILFKNKLND